MPTYILISDGFDELEVVIFLHKFRQVGLSIKSVSLSNRLVYSRQGVGLKADYQLADNPFNSTSDCLLILPTGGHNADQLRYDARVKILLQSFNAGGGNVAITDTASHLATDLSDVLVDKPPYHPHVGQDLYEFAQDLADRVVSAS
ncbi:MAG: DJ-1/PfpI family protein [Chloroflexota bacterium]|jgi:putative intracellular protease/amidase